MPKEQAAHSNMPLPSDDPAAFGRPRPRSQNVSSRPFAGRIGGNQEFVASGDDEESEAILKKQPDAAPIWDLRDSLDLKGFLVLATWTQAVIEGWGTCMLIFVFGAAANGLPDPASTPLANTAYAALVNWIGLSLFILAAAPASGGHLNPSITMATFFAGLSTLPRTVLYIVAQVTGAIVGSFWLRLGVGEEYFFQNGIPGCTVDPTTVSPGQLFALEFLFAQALIFIAFGIGLDPRQAKVFGAALSPILIGASLSLGTLASSLAKPGYSGISFNPARCAGLMAAKGVGQFHYVHWLGPLAAAMLNGIFYHFAPPYIRDRPMSATNPAVPQP